MFQRYAIYFTPAPGPLADFGAAWLGWDAVTGRAVRHPNISGLPRPVSEITETPRKYGLHATIKPPFRRRPDTDESTLCAALAAFCADQPIIALNGLRVAQLGRFLALRPVGDESKLNTMAADAVRAFDTFRAPLTDPELRKRREGGLTVAQDALLRAWGYPYVMEEFRFHITLTGKLPKAEGRALVDRLQEVLAPVLPKPFIINGLSLMGEDDSGYFHQIARHSFAG